MAFDKNTGVNKLANVLCQRMRKESSSPLALDFGEIQKNGSLVTNTFPVPVKKGDYSICRQLAAKEEESGRLRPGDRVLVAWFQNDAVVIDIVADA